MLILKVSDVYFPRVNGVSTSIETFRRDLQALGHEVVLTAPAYAGVSSAETGIDRVRSRAVPKDPEDRIMNWRELKTTLARCGGEVDVIHIHTPFLAHYAGLQLARARGIPVIATYHTLFEEYLHHYVPILPRPVGRRLARAFSRSQCNQLDAVIAPSRAMRDALRDYGVRQPIEVLPTGLPADRFRQGDGAAFRQRHGISAHRPLLLFVGRAAHEKNIGFLIRMMPSVLKTQPDALLLIAGEGPAAASLQTMAAQTGVAESIRFMGYFNRDTELQDCYSAADLFVFASLTETQGLVLLEAMAQSVPVVAIPRMGTIDILAPEVGCKHAPDDVEGFAAATLGLLGATDQRKRMGAEARDYALTWSSHAQAQRLVDLYSTLIAGARRTGVPSSPGATEMPSRS